MRVRIVINTRKAEELGDNRSQIWEGELEINDRDEYLTMISVIAEGLPQPICQVPFAVGIGHYVWVPPDKHYEGGDYEYGALSD